MDGGWGGGRGELCHQRPIGFRRATRSRAVHLATAEGYCKPFQRVALYVGRHRAGQTNKRGNTKWAR